MSKRNTGKRYRINYFRLGFVIVLFIVLIAGIVALISTIAKAVSDEDAEEAAVSNGKVVYKEYDFDDISQEEEPKEPITADYPEATDSTFAFGEEILSQYGVLVDLQSNTIVAQRNADDRMYPASLTKIMTLIVAVENIDDFDATFTMTSDIIDPLVQQSASVAGFASGEECLVKDLLYGLILPSGADASTALAIYIAGNEESFVEMMNQKAEDLGLENTHFTNTSGLHNDNHYSTALDFAVILKYAMDNETCREVLSQFQYTTAVTEQHPEGIALTSDLFARMYGDEADGFTILGGKTGFTDQAGHCLGTFAKNNESGDEYLLILAKASGSKWYPVYDTEFAYEYLNSTDIPNENLSDSYQDSDNTSAE